MINSTWEAFHHEKNALVEKSERFTTIKLTLQERELRKFAAQVAFWKPSRAIVRHLGSVLCVNLRGILSPVSFHHDNNAFLKTTQSSTMIIFTLRRIIGVNLQSKCLHKGPPETPRGPPEAIVVVPF